MLDVRYGRTSVTTINTAEHSLNVSGSFGGHASVIIDARSARIIGADGLHSVFHFTNIQSAASSPRALPSAAQAVHDVESFYATSATRTVSFSQTLTVQSQLTTAAGDV